MADCLALPKGWKREEVVRKTGISSGKIDVYYYSPNGLRFRSKPQLARFLGDSIDLTTFDFRTGKINPSLLRKGRRQKGNQLDFSRNLRNEATLVPPIRQTASIFKQPVTLIKSQPNSKTRLDLKHGPVEKPKQLFWEKRLQDFRANNIDQENYEQFDLPRNVKAVGPNMSDDTAIRSISTALHLHIQPIVGQSKSSVEKNISVFLNTEQPFVSTLNISDDEIKRQEEKVLSVRKKLENALSQNGNIESHEES